MMEQELKDKIDEITREFNVKVAARELLKIPTQLDILTVLHKNRGPSDFASVMIRTQRPDNKMTMLEARTLLRSFDEAGLILQAPRWKSPSTLPTWAPDDCNCSLNDAKSTPAEKVDDQSVELRITGGRGYESRQLSVWARLPMPAAGELGMPIDVSVELSDLPSTWRPAPKIWFLQARQDWVCALDLPKGLSTARKRVEFGSPASWEITQYWATFDEFDQDVRRG